jgi:cytosine/adenosine deaminase-related metal-dependent hydrolase
MKTLIDGGWVVAFNGTSHEVYENGSVVFEDNRIVHAGGPYTGATDVRLSARGRLVSPGFINTHVHTAGNGGDYMLHDMAKNDYRTSNYLSFAAPLKGKVSLPPPAAMAALRTFVFLHALKHGSTTIIDVGGLRGDWEGYVRLVDELGVRVYTSPPFRDRNTFTDAQGRLYYDVDTAAGTQGLEAAIDFIRTYDGAAQGRLRGMLNPAQVETCSEPLLRACKAAAHDLDVPVHTHAGGNLLEFQRIMDEYRKTPVQFLADIGFLDDRTLIGHGVFTTAHPWTHYPFGDDLRVLAETGATVGHCPYKYAKMAITLHSLQRYLDAGVNVALGTDTFPMDMVAELRWASMLAKITEHNYQVGQPRDVYNAATLAAGKFLRRQDLGRLAPGARADILLIQLDHLGSAFYTDPIKALVDFGCGRDVDTVIVDGKILVQDGRAVHVDEEAVYAQACQATQHFWRQVPTWHWGGYALERIIPPAFPMHRASTAAG